MGREARMRKIKAKESKIRRLRMPRAPTEKMHKCATRLARWFKHTQGKNRMRRWLAVRRISASMIARIYRGYRCRQIAKKLAADREIKRERERRILQFEEEERLREQKEAEEAAERRKLLDEKHKERKLRRKIRDEIRRKEQKRARKYVVKHMRKQISNRFRDKSIGGETLKESDSNESKSSSSESGALSSSNLDTEDEDGRNFRSMPTIKNTPQNPTKKQRKIKWEKFQTRHGNPHMSSRMTIRAAKSTGKSLASKIPLKLTANGNTR